MGTDTVSWSAPIARRPARSWSAAEASHALPCGRSAWLATALRSSVGTAHAVGLAIGRDTRAPFAFNPARRAAASMADVPGVPVRPKEGAHRRAPAAAVGAGSPAARALLKTIKRSV